jgi:hypothetical protein
MLSLVADVDAPIKCYLVSLMPPATQMRWRFRFCSASRLLLLISRLVNARISLMALARAITPGDAKHADNFALVSAGRSISAFSRAATIYLKKACGESGKVTGESKC